MRACAACTAHAHICARAGPPAHLALVHGAAERREAHLGRRRRTSLSTRTRRATRPGSPSRFGRPLSWRGAKPTRPGLCPAFVHTCVREAHTHAHCPGGGAKPTRGDAGARGLRGAALPEQAATRDRPRSEPRGSDTAQGDDRPTTAAAGSDERPRGATPRHQEAGPRADPLSTTRRRALAQGGQLRLRGARARTHALARRVD